jgi:hypothetical protein
MYNGLVSAHSGLRWIILILLLLAIVNAFRSKSSGRYEKKDKMLNLFAMISLHIQLLVGLALFFINERGRVDYPEGWIHEYPIRFFSLEHWVAMIIAIAIITMGRSNAEKKLIGSRDKHRRIFISYTIGLIIILLSIPWPFLWWKDLGAGWF